MSRRQPYNLPSSQDGAKVFWKSLEDKANPDVAQKRAESEFPLGFEEANVSPAKLVQLRRKDAAAKAESETPSLGRRSFMFFAGASAALAAEGCARRPVEKILPYSQAPEHVLPGVSAYYATVFEYRGDALGVLVESHEGRPTKVEGNPEHPASRGATDAFAQAAIYDLYDPDRSTTPLKGARAASGTGFNSHTPATWQEIDGALAEMVRASTADRGAKLRFLAPPTNSPTVLRLREAVRAKLPKAQFHVWAPVSDANVREGTKIAFGQALNVVPDFTRAKIVVALDSDFLGTETGPVRASRGFSVGRKLPQGPHGEMNRLYVVEPSFTTTGMNADHRLRLPAQHIEGYLVALSAELAKLGVDTGVTKEVQGLSVPEKWLKVVAKELVSARGQSVLVAGSRQPAGVHALVAAINHALGNTGRTVDYFPVADLLDTDPAASLKQLVADIDKGAVGTLVILGGNPVYDAPSDFKFGEKLKAVPTTFHLSSHANETSDASLWHAPRALELEAWGDQRTLDGVVSIQQPLIAPLFDGRSDIEILGRFASESSTKGYDLVQQTAKGNGTNPVAFTAAWNEALKKGVFGLGARSFGSIEPRRAEIAAAVGKTAPVAFSPDNLEVTFAPCPKLFDGRHANNPLLLELPDPVTKITWDNVALVSETTAKALGVDNRQVVRLVREGAQPVDIAVWITPGQADHSLAVVLGWGRQNAGRYGSKHGFDIGGLRTSDALGFTAGVKANKLSAGELDATRDRYRKVGMAAAESPPPGRVRPDSVFDAESPQLYKISQTQEHHSMEGRPIAIDATLEEYRKNAFFPRYPNDERKDKNLHDQTVGVRESGSPDPKVAPLWPTVDYSKGHKWGMAIDLSSCTGCNACVMACHIENNVPAVGKEQVERGREMAWLRIDRYFVGLDANDPQVVFQPVACVHCEEAPCENVCPVNATEHSPEGLNDMAYNRCIGTRYCANNCPYKVRRFNYLNYHTSGGWYDDVPEVEKMRYNPNVTVRMRGVMEKCSYCVQRIQEAKIKSKRTGKPIKDGDIKAACQQACASDCIVFGDLNDPNSRVAQWRDKDRAYRLLAELGTRPRTSYLGKIRNPNPEMGA